MVDDEVVEGLKAGLERGQSLRKAMMTLFNAGYKKEEIEEAAKSLIEYKPENQAQLSVKKTSKPSEIKPISQMPILAKPRAPPEFNIPVMPAPQLIKPVQSVQKEKIKEEVKQKVSGYGQPMQPPVKPKLEVEKVKKKGFFQRRAEEKQKKKLEEMKAKANRPITLQKISSNEKPVPRGIKEEIKQKISSYEPSVSKGRIKEGRKASEKIIISILVFLLIFLTGLLVAIFIFKDKLMEFFNAFFE